MTYKNGILKLVKLKFTENRNIQSFRIDVQPCVNRITYYIYNFCIQFQVCYEKVEYHLSNKDHCAAIHAIIFRGSKHLLHLL